MLCGSPATPCCYGGVRDGRAGDGRSTSLLVHVGGVQFAITGPVRYTMTGREAVELSASSRPRMAVPVHYEGWSHFKDGRAQIQDALAGAPAATRGCVRWLTPGSPTDVD